MLSAVHFVSLFLKFKRQLMPSSVRQLIPLTVLFVSLWKKQHMPSSYLFVSFLLKTKRQFMLSAVYFVSFLLCERINLCLQLLILQHA